MRRKRFRPKRRGSTPNTTYYFQIVATGEEGTGEGNPVSFKTIANAPVATTGKAGEVKLTSAVLEGTVNPEGVTLRRANSSGGPAPARSRNTRPCSPQPGSGTGARSRSRRRLTETGSAHDLLLQARGHGEGGKAEGAEEEFTTPASGLAVVDRRSGGRVTRTTAKLNGHGEPGRKPRDRTVSSNTGPPKARRKPASRARRRPGRDRTPVDVSAEVTEANWRRTRPTTSSSWPKTKRATPSNPAQKTSSPPPGTRPRVDDRGSDGRDADLRHALGDGEPGRAKK